VSNECMRFLTITARIVGTLAAIAGGAVLVFVVKALGDFLFPEIPGVAALHAVLVILLGVLVASALFFEAYRLLGTARSKQVQ
jgi:drug/metabolite transporter (DMT)-like permease